MNMFGIGIDIIELSRIEKAVKNAGFVNKNFTPKEIEEFNKLKNPVPRIAAYFAMKEAITKAIGTGIGVIGLIDIEILKDDRGKPYLNPNSKLSALLDDLNISEIQLSCSHCKEYAVANAYANLRSQ